MIGWPIIIIKFEMWIILLCVSVCGRHGCHDALGGSEDNLGWWSFCLAWDRVSLSLLRASMPGCPVRFQEVSCVCLPFPHGGAGIMDICVTASCLHVDPEESKLWPSGLWGKHLTHQAVSPALIPFLLRVKKNNAFVCL